MKQYACVIFLSLAALLCRCAQCEPATSGDSQNRDAIHDAVSVAKCRLRCLDEFLPKEGGGAGDEEECELNKECSVCWKICDYLQQDFKTWGEMCVFPHEICYDGCIQACLFHLDQDITTHYTATAVIDNYSFPAEPRVSGNRVTWQKVREETKIPMRNSGNKKKTIYSVLVAPEGHDWILVGQTLGTKVRLDPEKRHSGTSRLMVLAVMKEGVVAVTRSSFVVSSPPEPNLRPSTEPPNLRPNGLPWSIPMASEIGTVMDGPPPGYSADSRVVGVALPDGDSMFATPPASVGVFSDIVTAAYAQEGDWNLRAKSVTRNPVFRTVDAVVAWSPKPNRHGEYMVTWEVNKENFGVKGHVYTRNSTVTLNLNPEEVYRVQVEFISRAKQQSEASPVILIDTHNITSPTYWPQEMSNQVNSFFFRSKFELIIMILVAFCALVLTFVAFVIWRMKRKQIRKRMRAEMSEGRESGASLENGVSDFDRARTLLLTDHMPRSVTPMTVSTATSPFEDSMFPKMFRFPSVTKMNTDPSATEVLIEQSPKKSAKGKVEAVMMVQPFVQSMPNIAPDALETHVTRFKNLQLPGSRASVAIGGSTEIPLVQNIVPLKVPPAGKRFKVPGTLEVVQGGSHHAFSSLQSINEARESR